MQNIQFQRGKRTQSRLTEPCIRMAAALKVLWALCAPAGLQKVHYFHITTVAIFNELSASKINWNDSPGNKHLLFITRTSLSLTVPWISLLQSKTIFVEYLLRDLQTLTGTKGNPPKYKSSLGQAKNVFLKNNWTTQMSSRSNDKGLLMIKDSFMGQLPTQGLTEVPLALFLLQVSQQYAWGGNQEPVRGIPAEGRSVCKTKALTPPKVWGLLGIKASLPMI